MTLEFAAQPAPDPAMFGMPAEDDGNRTDPLLGQNIVSCTHFEPDFEALRAASTRIVLAAGVESEGQMAYRGAIAAAERLGTAAVSFPSDHGGFLGGEYGQAGDPDAFAAKLREVLAERSRVSRRFRSGARPGRTSASTNAAAEERTMDFGVHLPQIGWDDEASSLDRLIAVASAAERLGFATISANDHLVYGRPWLDGPTALASILIAAPTVRLMTTVALPIVRGPFALAKALGALDVLSGGRLDAGLGPGSSAADYAARRHPVRGALGPPG